MKNDNKTELKVGITVLIAALILLWIIGWAKNISIFNEDKHLSVLFDNVAGLAEGDIVAVNGLKSGYVENINNTSGGVLVKLTLDKDVKLKEDAKFYIMMLDLMGGKKVEISPGNSGKPIDWEHVYRGYFKGDISSALAALSSVQTDMVEAIKEVRIALANVNDLFADNKFVEQIKTGIDNLVKLTSNFDNILSENRDGITRLIDNSNSLIDTTKNLIDKNKEDLNELLISAKIALRSSNDLILKLDKLISETENSGNNLGKLIYDEETYENLKKSLIQLKSLTELLNKQLREQGIKVEANLDIF